MRYQGFITALESSRGGGKMTERIRCALSIIARCQSQYETLRPESQPRDFAVG